MHSLFLPATFQVAYSFWCPPKHFPLGRSPLRVSVCFEFGTAFEWVCGLFASFRTLPADRHSCYRVKRNFFSN